MPANCDFGENKVQEALQKIAQSTDTRLRWHLIGHLQSNKAQEGGRRSCNAIHAVDSVDLLKRSTRRPRDAGRTVDVLIQVDLALEDTKHGAPVDATCRRCSPPPRSCTAARLVGLMLLPPLAENPEDARPWFARLRALRDELADGGVPADRLRELSMGMSHDFEVAIEEGATMVRVGTAIFGARDYSMKVTPLDLRQQRFKTVMRGYDRGEVQAFLLEVADDYENALRENDKLRQDVAKLEAVLGEHRGQERNLRNTLLTAQKLADEIRENAQTEAALIVREAEGRADLLLQKAQARLEDVQREIDGLRMKRREVENDIEALIRTLNTHARVHSRSGRALARGARPAPPPAAGRSGAGAGATAGGCHAEDRHPGRIRSPI